jgi:hypothetical protein
VKRPIIVIGVRRWVVAVSLLAVAAGFASKPLAAWLGRPKVVVVQAPRPPEPRPCNDAAAIGVAGGVYNCNRGEVIEVRPLDGEHAVVICRCPADHPELRVAAPKGEGKL